jgi:hypothetical protein
MKTPHARYKADMMTVYDTAIAATPNPQVQAVYSLASTSGSRGSSEKPSLPPDA